LQQVESHIATGKGAAAQQSLKEIDRRFGDWQRRAASSWRERSSCRQSEHAVSSAQLLKPGVARVARSGRLALLVHGHPDGKVPGIADAMNSKNKGGSADAVQGL